MWSIMSSSSFFPADDGYIYFWRIPKILFWPLFAMFCQKYPKWEFMSVISQQLKYYSFWNIVIYWQMHYIDHLLNETSFERYFLRKKHKFQCFCHCCAMVKLQDAISQILYGRKRNYKALSNIVECFLFNCMN